jgi:hypothetical protein
MNLIMNVKFDALSVSLLRCSSVRAEFQVTLKEIFYCLVYANSSEPCAGTTVALCMH